MTSANGLGKKKSYAAIMVVYLLGVFMGSVDTGIVMPARTVVQGYFGVDGAVGIWMITAYTLAYAASIPIMGTLADRHGRKRVFLISILLFGLGSLGCGLSSYTNNFAFLILARVVQAIGGGGIMPLANAEFGTAFPVEKRGVALGMVGSIYGIANIIGSSFGTAVMNLFGTQHWAYIFYLNVPIALFIFILGFFKLEDNVAEEKRPIDIWGSFFFVIIIVFLMSALRNLDFFNFFHSFTDFRVYGGFLIAAVLIPLFIKVEHRAAGPILNLGYFTDRNIALVLAIAVTTGFIMMGMVFVPQFSENVLRMPSGSGGYFVLILGLTSGAAAPLSGRLVDMIGARAVLIIGFLLSLGGGLFLGYVTASYPSLLFVWIGLLVAGAGIGFVMGTPLNYMMLEHTKAKEANSALATLSLIRSFGSVVAPAIMIAFLTHAGSAFQTNVTQLLPKTIEFGNDPYVSAVVEDIDVLKSDPDYGLLVDFELPTSVELDADSFSSGTEAGVEMPEDVVNRLKNSDVTTVVDDLGYMTDYMFDSAGGQMTQGLNEGIARALAGIDEISTQMGGSVPEPLAQLQEDLIALQNNSDSVLESAAQNYKETLQDNHAVIEDEFQATLNNGFRHIYTLVAGASLVGLLLLLFYRNATASR